MRWTRDLLLTFSLLLPSSCVLYDAELLARSQGGSVDGSGGTGPGTGGMPGTGGGSTGGSSATGGSDPTNSGGLTGDGDGDGDGTGGNAECDGVGKGPFTGVDGTPLLVDDFNEEWQQLGPSFSGNWIAGGDGLGSALSPDDNDIAGGSWFYDADPCLTADDLSLHITGTGYTSWGASYDANLEGGSEVSLSAYSGVAFWARTDATPKNQVQLAFSDDTTGSGEPAKEPIKASPVLIDDEWTEYKIAFPAGVNLAKVKVVHIVVPPAATFDLWIDDLSFYVAAPAL